MIVVRVQQNIFGNHKRDVNTWQWGCLRQNGDRVQTILINVYAKCFSIRHWEPLWAPGLNNIKPPLFLRWFGYITFTIYTAHTFVYMWIKKTQLGLMKILQLLHKTEMKFHQVPTIFSYIISFLAFFKAKSSITPSKRVFL